MKLLADKLIVYLIEAKTFDKAANACIRCGNG